jgi:predicted ATP-grasp superfamily ATP-dependent carboligase
MKEEHLEKLLPVITDEFISGKKLSISVLANQFDRLTIFYHPI